MKHIKIREEIPQDAGAIRGINEQAFGQPQEANIADKLRANCGGLLSLVALQDEKIVGHILFSPVTIEGSFGILKGMGLAPMAVLAQFQTGCWRRVGSSRNRRFNEIQMPLHHCSRTSRILSSVWI